MTPNKSIPFRLSSTLAGHTSDVRSLSSTSSSSSTDNPILFSSSRDGTARSWYRNTNQSEEDVNMDGKGGTGGGWRDGIIFEGSHDGFVGAVQWIGDEGNG